jgi:hypothetical protein
MENLESKVRKMGYQLAVRELYGENTPEYYRRKRLHDRLLEDLEIKQGKMPLNK